MLVRMLTILMLLIQPLALLEVKGQGSGGGEHGDCCVSVVRVTCCGDEPVELVDCDRTFGSCICEASPGDTPQVPWTPSRDSSGAILLFAGSSWGFASFHPVDARLSNPPAMVSTRGSHRQARALLCSWRT